MALTCAPQVVDALEKIIAAGHLRRMTEINAITIRSMANGWFNIKLSASDIRETMAAAGLASGKAGNPYSVTAVYRALEPGGVLRELVAIQQADVESALQRVLPGLEQGPLLRRIPPPTDAEYHPDESTVSLLAGGTG